MTKGYRGPQVCKIVNISYRQLDYWARTGLSTPSLQAAKGSGSQRLYSFEDLVELKLIKKLLDAGVSLQKVRDAIGYLKDLVGEDLGGVTLASDGESIIACRSENEFIDLMRKGQGVFGIAIGPVMDEVQASVSHLPLPDEQAEAPEEPASSEAAPKVAAEATTKAPTED